MALTAQLATILLLNSLLCIKIYKRNTAEASCLVQKTFIGDTTASGAFAAAEVLEVHVHQTFLLIFNNIKNTPIFNRGYANNMPEPRPGITRPLA